MFCTFLNKCVMRVDLLSSVMTGEGPQLVLITQTLHIEGRCNYSLEKSLHKGTLYSKHGSSAVLTERLFCQVTTCLFCVLFVNGEASLKQPIQTHRCRLPFIFGSSFTLYDYIVVKQIVQNTALLLSRK